MTDKRIPVFVVGYQPRESILPDDYRDFRVGAKFDFVEAVEMARAGVFPPGIILQAPGGVPCVIKGGYDTPQVAVPLEAA
jgi:hypothetical protein